MALLKREIKLEWKVNPNYFTVVNSKNLTMPVKRIGSARPSVNRMLSNDEMMRALMPNILGIDPTSQSSNWTKEVAEYWHSLCIEVPQQGLTLNTSMLFDIGDGHPIRSKYIKLFLEKNKSIDTSDAMMEALTSPASKLKVSEEELYRYGSPESITDYMLWVYCKNYRLVANDLDSINKSNRIEFYMYDIQSKAEAKKQSSKKVLDATQLFVKLSSDPTALKDTLCILAPDRIKSIVSMSNEDITLELHQLLMNKPSDFVTVATDKNLNMKAKIEMYIAVNVLKRHLESKAIVDAIDQTRVIGYTLEEAIVYLSSEEVDKKKYLNDLEIRFKNTIK